MISSHRNASLRTRRSTRRPNLHLEPLEDRRVLSVSIAYVNDDWAFVSDEDESESLTTGDLVNDANDDVADPGAIVGSFGVNAFGVVTSGEYTGGSGTIADALAATASGGETRVLPGSYSGNVSIDQPIRFTGSFTLSSGNLSMSDDEAVLQIGDAPESIELSSGNLSLSAGTLLINVDDAGDHNQLAVNGTVALSDVALQVFFGDYDAAVDTEYLIIDNDSTDAVSGTFAGLAQDDTFEVGERTLQIDYAGGDGNDVVLRVTSQLNSFQSFVNDDWYDVDETSPIEVGDLVDNRNDTGGAASVTRYFKTPSVFNDFQSAAYDDLQEAIDATATGGIVTILPGSYSAGGSGEVIISKRLHVEGAFTFDGALIVEDAPVNIFVGSEFGTIAVSGLQLSSSTRLALKESNGDGDLIDVDGEVDLGGAVLDLRWADFEATGNILLIDNDESDPVVGYFAGLPEGALIQVRDQRFWITYEGGDGNDVELVIGDSWIAARNIFYNQSAFDGNSASINGDDDGAIATDKVAFLSTLEGPASFANVTSYTRGINGIMVDIAGDHGTLTTDDFTFLVGSNNAPGDWAAAPAPAGFAVRTGEGIDDSDRVVITWADGDIRNTYLQVIVEGNDSTGDFNTNTGLAISDVFFFGNRVADSGTSTPATHFQTTTSDGAQVFANLSSGVAIDNLWDYNRDGNVTSADATAVFANIGTLTRILLLDPQPGPQPLAAVDPNPRIVPVDNNPALTAASNISLQYNPNGPGAAPGFLTVVHATDAISEQLATLSTTGGAASAFALALNQLNVVTSENPSVMEAVEIVAQTEHAVQAGVANINPTNHIGFNGGSTAGLGTENNAPLVFNVVATAPIGTPVVVRVGITMIGVADGGGAASGSQFASGLGGGVATMTANLSVGANPAIALVSDTGTVTQGTPVIVSVNLALPARVGDQITLNYGAATGFPNLFLVGLVTPQQDDSATGFAHGGQFFHFVATAE